MPAAEESSLDNAKTTTSALYWLSMVATSVFVAEFIIMFVMDLINIQSPLQGAVIDSTALVVLVFPALYFFCFRPLAGQNKKLSKMSEKIAKMNRELERRVETRTEELSEANKQLGDNVVKLAERQREMSSLRQISQQFQTCRDMEEIGEVVSGRFGKLLEGSSGSFFKCIPSGESFDQVTTWGSAGGKTKEKFECTECFGVRLGGAYESGVDEDEHILCRHFQDAQATHNICIPLSSNGELLGLLSIQKDVSRAGEAESAADQSDFLRLAGALTENLVLTLSNIHLRKRLHDQATRDALTGIFNRRFLDEILPLELEKAKRARTTLSAIILDIDHFKKFNDTYGHAAGDVVLKAVGQLLKEHFRGSDIACRFGGEEFLVILPNADLEEATRRSEQLRMGIESLTLEFGGHSLAVTASCGVASFPINALDQKSLLSSADEALYAAKESGRNKTSVAPRLTIRGDLQEDTPLAG